MISLNVSIERDGELISVGTIRGNDSKTARFQYLPDYVHDISSAAISVSLPLREEPFTVMQTSAFFEGLLPEGFTRHTVAQWMRVDETDYLSILHGLGRECLGAICITEENESLHASYEKIPDGKISELAAEGAMKSAEIVTKTHLSLTGASGKVGLYYAADRREWYLPSGTAPSTHIIKQSHVRLDSIVANEQLALQTAARCGIQVPDSFIINVGNGEDREVLFAAERYDRTFSGEPERINGLPRPQRLHQEDFAQAMGISADQKYERKSGGYMKWMFDILRQYSTDPIADQIRLWDTIIFNVLIGNTDAHVKNFSLLYTPDLKSVRLAPAYDIVSTTIYEQSTHDMAFSIGGVYSIDDIDRNILLKAAGEAGLGNKIAAQRLDLIRSRFPDALARSAEDLNGRGFSKSLAIRDRILKNGGIRNFM